MMTAETGAAERAQWIANLDEVAALEPTFVVAGHLLERQIDNGFGSVDRRPALKCA
jgi:hypothetical protein